VSPYKYGFATYLLISLVTLSACGTKTDGNHSANTYPVTSQFTQAPKDWCIGYLGYPEVPLNECETYYVQAVATELYSYYGINTPIFNECFKDANGNYGWIQDINCLNIKSLEDIARERKP